MIGYEEVGYVMCGLGKLVKNETTLGPAGLGRSRRINHVDMSRDSGSFLLLLVGEPQLGVSAMPRSRARGGQLRMLSDHKHDPRQYKCDHCDRIFTRLEHQVCPLPDTVHSPLTSSRHAISAPTPARNHIPALSPRAASASHAPTSSPAIPGSTAPTPTPQPERKRPLASKSLVQPTSSTKRPAVVQTATTRHVSNLPFFHSSSFPYRESHMPAQPPSSRPMPRCLTAAARTTPSSTLWSAKKSCAVPTTRSDTRRP